MKKKKYYELIIMETDYEHKPLSIYEIGNTTVHRHFFESEKDREIARNLIKFYNVPYTNKQGHYIMIKVFDGNEMKLTEKEKKNYE